MEKLKIVNREAFDLGDQYGIPQERRDFLSAMLNELVKSASTGKIKLVYVCDIIEHIRGHCVTEEEYTWALMLHMQWMFRTGRVLKPFTRR